MSWVTLVWSMLAAASLTLAAIHLLIWCQKRTAWGNLLFSVAAAGTAGLGFCELGMMLARTTEEYATALRWLHVPGFVIVVSLLAFVRVQLQAGRAWLAWTTGSLRAISLLLNFATGENLNFRAVTAVQSIPFLGEPISIGAGVSNPWMLVGQLSLVAFVVFVADASLGLWRRGERRQALVTGGSILFFTFAGTVLAVLVLWQIIPWPYTASVFFLGINGVMAHELGRDTLRAAQLADDLRASEERFRQVAALTGEFIWEVDAQGRFTYASPSVERTLGYTPQELVGRKHFHDLLAPSVRADLKTAVLEVFATRRTFRRLPITCVSKDGTLVQMETSGTPVLDPAGRFLGFRGSDVDVTAHNLAEQEIARQRTELAHLTRVTTLSELSGSLAHELNQPLGIILSNAQAAQDLVRQEPPALAEIGEILSDIVAADRRAAGIIERMRALLKRGELSLQPLPLNDLLEEVLHLVRADLIGRGVTPICNFAPDLPLVRGDRVQLQQLALNLILNAADAMAANPVVQRRLHLTTSRQPDAVRTTVRDEGVGLPADIERLFQPFVTTKAHGLGMGLAICRTLVSAHKGRLWAEPHSERGAVFHFDLPLAGAPVQS